jgi:hypothetical protein
MRRAIGILIGGFLGLALAYGPTAHFACRAAPENNLCGLNGMFAAPFGLFIGAFAGGWLAGRKRRTNRLQR